MTDRTVRVRLQADLGAYSPQMTRATAQTARFGEVATIAGRGVRVLGADAGTAAVGLAAAGTGARGGAAGLRAAEVAAAQSGRAMTAAGTASRGAFASIRGGAAGALAPVKSLGLLLAGGSLIYGIHKIVEQGNEYSDAMLKFSEVTRASGAQMQAAGREAQALGADMRLPSANSAEAADAMVDLAKAGLGAQDAIKAARGTIQLAAAARTDVATAAQIEGDIMDQFALKSTSAAHVADVLANTSNSASGQLIDLYYAMKYVGPTAHSLGVSVDEAATAVGLLGKSGIIGETAGTSLRGALVNLAKPTRQMKNGLKELGIEAFDSKGRFKGLQYVVTQLHDAQERLTQQQFTSAAAMAFGKPALSAMTALAHQGGEAFEQFGTQVGRVGGAENIAAAESKGLGGAMRGLGKQLSSTFLQVYQGVSPVLEGVTRRMTTGISSAIPYVKRGIRTAGDLWTLYGPAVEAHLHAAEAGIGRAAKGVAAPLHQALAGIVVNDAGLAVAGVRAVDTTLRNAASAATPLEGGMQDVARSVSGTSGAVGVLSGRLQTAVGWAGDLTGVLRPIASVVGGVAHAFAGLPGPVQLSVLSMLALRPFRGQISAMQTSVVGFGRAGINAFRGVGDASLYQRVQAAHAGVTLSRMGGVMAELETRSRTIALMGASFRSTSGSIQAAGGRLVGFRAAAGGAATAIGVGAGRGLLGATRGLVGFLGGPWGIAIAAAMIGLDMLAKKHQQAAAAEQAHQQRISTLAQALQASNGVVDESVRAAAAQMLQDSKLADGKTRLMDVMGKSGVTLKQLTDGYLGGSTVMGKLGASVAATAAASLKARGPMDATTKAQMQAVQALKDMGADLPDAVHSWKDIAAATKDASGAATSATSPTSRLQGAIRTLGDSTSDAATKASALHTALDLLSGGELDVQAAVADMNSAVTDLNGTWKDGVDHAKGYKDQLLQVDGSLNTTSANGQELFNKLQALNGATASAAQATFDYATANGTSVPEALQQAEKSMQTAYDAAVAAGKGFGLATEDAQLLAAQMGFIPSNLAITLDTKGLTDTEKDLLYVQGLAGHLPKDSTVKVTALTADAVKDIESVGYKVHTLPGGRQMEITAPTAKAAKALDDLIAKKIPGKAATVQMLTSQAEADLTSLQRKVAKTKGRTVTIKAPTAEAQADLKALGFKITQLPDKKVKVTIPTGGAAAAAATIHNYINGITGKTVTIRVTKADQVNPINRGNANGNIYRRAYADGGMEQHVAQIAPGGSMRLWAEPETGGEAYIPLSPAKRNRSTAILRMVAKQFGYDLEHFAQGGITAFAGGGLGGFTYSPADPTATLGVSAGWDRYSSAVDRVNTAGKTLASALADAAKKAGAVRDAERNLSKVRSRHHTAAQLAAAENTLTKARTASSAAAKKVTADRKALNSADSALGVKVGTKSVSGFNLAAYAKQLAAANSANAAWERNLATVGKRAGSDVEDILRGMGDDGTALVAALAKATGSQFTTIVNQLKALAPTAQATLADYTAQLDAANKGSAAFQANLLKLASMGDTALASQLAAQGDDAAAAIAAAAVKSPGAAAAANTGAATSASLLTPDDLANAITVLGVLRSHPGAGIADVIAAGIDWATLRTLAPKIASQVKAISGSDTFVQQMRGQQVAMARGGILTQPTTVLAAEAGKPESWIPWDSTARSRALLARTATAFGYHLTPMRGTAAGAPPVQHSETHHTWHLHGAHQSLAEQKADLVRHMTFVG
ncbi:phage tail tape measure protein [Streptomyces sp. NBC_01477]|uniref:phage tail tape measure protein n=1 Tax=Streptomyces sp. NBC_01477 TaxID=2976015 RepID=UPI002E34AC04|nr:phage tail tape measure protein [Streptomyces sp. NBC_01477]